MGKDATDSVVGGRSLPQPTDAPLILHVKDPCRECWSCVRHCPAKAIRVLDGHAEVIEEKCVKCGLCVSECGNHAHQVRNDTARVWELLRGERPVVALVATEFLAALAPMNAPEVEQELGRLGFESVETTLLGEEIVAAAYEKLHARDDLLFVLRSTCPVTVDWVRKYHPEFTSALAPIVPPYIAQARLIRTLYPDDVAIVYVSPCYARKDEAYDPQFDGAVDAAIDFLELKRMFAALDEGLAVDRSRAKLQRRPNVLKQVSLTDGFPRLTLASRSMTDADVGVVRGLRELDMLLRAMAAGESAPRIVDMLNCEGCIDGPAVNPGLSVYAKRTAETAEREMRGTTRVSTREILGVLPSVDIVRSFQSAAVRPPVPSEDQIDRILVEGEFASRQDALDCGACGYETCVEHALAIFQDNSSWEMCFPLQRRRLERHVETLSADAPLDEATGLWSRRIFSERLAEEVARHTRYKAPVSLLLVHLADGRGDGTIAEAEVAAAAAIVHENVRRTDVPARYSADELAIILPGVGKTQAFAAAEKLKETVRSADAWTAHGYTQRVDVRLSVGVASAGVELVDPADLLEAADKALHRAKRSGGDQVSLAPG